MATNKLFLVCATLAFFFLLTNASIYRTVVEFDEDDVTNPQSPRQKCRKEFQQEQHLRACQQWIRRQTRQGGRPSLDDEFDFEDDIDNQRPRQQKHPLLQQCCHELRQEDPECVCPTLKRAAKAVRRQEEQQQQQQQHGPHQARQIFRTAKHLPDVCNIREVDVCPFSAEPSSFNPYAY